MNLNRKTVAISMSLLLASLSLAVPAQAAQNHYVSTKQELDIFIWDDEDTDCTQFDGCPEEKRNISYRDHHIGPDLPNGWDEDDDDPYYMFYNTAGLVYPAYHYEFLEYELCMFDGNEELLRCDYIHGDWIQSEDIDRDTEYFRVILREGALAEYGVIIRS